LRLASETPIQIPQLNSEVFVSNVSHYLVEEVKYYYLEENGERVLKVVCICRPLGYLPPETPLPE
jgi:hypothetical protein